MKPCAIPSCPALRAKRSPWCAVHKAMSHFGRAREQRQAEEAMKPPQLQPVTTRVEYERDKP